MTPVNRATKSLVPGLSRRNFIHQVAATMAVGTLASPALLLGETATSAPASKMLVGSNVYGWTQYYERMQKNANEHLDEVLSALRDGGYDYLEYFLDVSHPENAAKLADQMKTKGMQPVSIYSGGRFHEEGKATETVQRLLEAAKTLQSAGYRVLSCNADPIGREKTDAELKVQIAALAALGRGLNKLGMKLGIHHHLPEMANQAREFHYNFKNSDPKEAGLCYDVHWVYRGGISPEKVLAEYSNRIVTWHLRQSRNGIWWEDLDTGEIDYAAVAAFAKKASLPRLFTVELALENGAKITRTVVENHQRSCDYVRRTFA